MCGARRCDRGARSPGTCRRGRCLTSWHCPFMLDASERSLVGCFFPRETIAFLLDLPAVEVAPRGIALPLDSLALRHELVVLHVEVGTRGRRRLRAPSEQVPDH